nr:hypothetical protein [Tanacetum cinerariifolium]
TPPPHPAYCMIARISIPAPVHMPAWSDSKIVRLFAMSSPPASPSSPWSSPPPQIPFPPLPPILSPPSPVLSPAPPPSPIRSLGYRAAMIRLRDEVASISSSPLQLSSASRKEDIPEVTLPPQKRLGRMTEIRELHAAERMRQTVILELLRTDHRRSIEITELRTTLQGHAQVTALQGQQGLDGALQAQVTALQGQQGLDGGPTQPELPEEAGSGS